MAVNKQCRVKVYLLNDDQEWDDLGTGEVFVNYVERLQGLALLVVSESNGTVILESRINPSVHYQRQQGALIVWSEAENHGMALSFEYKATCQEIWEDICRIQGKDPSAEITQEFPNEAERPHSELLDTSAMDDLPSCQLNTLQQISDVVSSVHASSLHRERLALFLENEDYIKSLLQLFRICESMDDIEGLHYLHEIVKGIIFLNKNALLEIMFSDEYIMDVVGCLEYDPTLDEPKKYREFLTQDANFREVIPITDCELKQRIHQTYRVQFIHDILIPAPGVYEDNLSSLTTFIYFNKIEIISMIQKDEKFLSDIFTQLKDKTLTQERLRELIFFMKEFCSFSQTLQPQNKNRLFRILTQLEVLPALKSVMIVNDVQIRSAATDIFAFLVDYNPSLIRGFVMEEAQKIRGKDLFINLLINHIITDSDPEQESATHLIGLLRTIVNPENMQATVHKCERSEFLNFFYKQCMHNLLAPLVATTSEDLHVKDTVVGSDRMKNCLNDYQTAQTLEAVLEFLMFCVQHHTFFIRNYILSKDLISKVLVLMNSSHTFLVLCAVRFIRRMIGTKDDLYNHYIINCNCFQPIVKALLNNGTRYNMLNSAIIELFDYIRVENIKPLVAHIVEKYYGQLASIEYVKTFKGLRVNYEHERQSELRKTFQTIVYNKIVCRSSRLLEEREEMYLKENKDGGEADMPPLEGDFQDYDKITEAKIAKRNEELVDLPSRASSSGDFNFTSSTVSINPNRSSLIDCLRYLDDEDEDGLPPRKIPHLE